MNRTKVYKKRNANQLLNENDEDEVVVIFNNKRKQNENVNINREQENQDANKQGNKNVCFGKKQQTTKKQESKKQRTECQVVQEVITINDIQQECDNNAVNDHIEDHEVILENYYGEERYVQYQKKCFSEREWPGVDGKCERYRNSFVIKELYRLVPYRMKPQVGFHALNMPDVKMYCATIVGTVISIRSRAQNRFLQLTVSDGTGAIEVNYNRTYIDKEEAILNKINEKHERFLKIALIKKPWLTDSLANQVPGSVVIHKTRPPFAYPNDIPLKYKLKLQHDWWLETKGGLLGKKIEIGDYLYIEGFCSLDYDRTDRPKGDIKVEHLLTGRLIMNAACVKCITEAEYNSYLKTWLKINVKNRYCKGS